MFWLKSRAVLISYLAVACIGFTACSDDDGGGTKGLNDFLPEVPSPTGDAQAAWAGEITSANTDELIDGPASSGMIGDFYMRNDKGRFVIQSATRVIGVIPQGGNLVDAVPLDGSGNDAAVDHFGELAMIYLVGRTCRHDSIEIVQDGSGGGAAVLRARGMAEANQFINLRGMGLLSVPLDLDPDVPDDMECATTYVLEPGSSRLNVRWTLFNGGTRKVKGPFGMFNDTGGQIETFAPTRGHERLGIDALTDATDAAPIEYVVYEGPKVSYGLLPVHEDPATTNSSFLIAGVSVVLYGAEKLLDIVNPDFFHLDLPDGDGITMGVDVSVGLDPADAEEQFRQITGEAVATVSGSVAWGTGGTPPDARVGLFSDDNNNGQLDDDDKIRTVTDIDASGNFSASVKPGDYLLLAEVKNQGRSTVTKVTVPAAGLSGQSMTVPSPVTYDYSITDDATGNMIPGKLTIIGRHPVTPDKRMFEAYDRYYGLIDMLWSLRGTSVDIGDGADKKIVLPVGGPYRIMVTRGTEWSMADVIVSPTAGETPAQLQFVLRRVVPTTGYVSTEHHVHLVGSPDSPVLRPKRIATMVADGVEVWSATDHDYVSDLQPIVESMDVAMHTRAIAGLETTPFAYGHFNSYPITPDNNMPNRGAIDHAQGMDGYAMLPGEIFDAMRAKGAELVQVNHPRNTNGITDFMQYFDRSKITYDYEGRSITGDGFRQPVPNDWLRLPGTELFSDSFNALEVWNGFDMGDTNDDGVREVRSADMVMRDWFTFLSFGKDITPVGNSDTHTAVKDPGGMPRTLVRVGDDSPSALSDGSIVAEVLNTMTANGVAKDLVITNGPHIAVTVEGDSGGSALGRIITPSGSVTFNVTVYSPMWAQIDTIEVFSNATPEVGRAALSDSALRPVSCATTRTGFIEGDTCEDAPVGGAQVLTVNTVDAGGGFERYEATFSFTFTQAEIAALNRAGATNGDAWFVFRVNGSRAIFPILTNEVLNEDNVDTLVSGDSSAQDAVLFNDGVHASAFTSAVYVDFDGGGYTAIFAP